MPRTRNDGGAAGATAERATGRELHDRVVALIAANPGMTQSAAFAQLVEQGDADGRTPANVAANYYRIQRQQGGGSGRRTANANGGQRTTRARRGDRNRSGSQVEATEQMLDRIERDVTDILSTLRDARASVAAVRDEAARIEAVRRALA